MLKLFVELSRIAVKFAGEHALLVKVKSAKHLAQIAINYIFYWGVRAPEHHVISAAKRLGLDSEEHLKVGKEV